MGVIDKMNPIIHSYHGSRNGSFSWAVSCGSLDVGSTESMKECLSWKRWLYSGELHEIFQYHEGITVSKGDIVEEK